MPGIITQKDSHFGALHGLSEYILNLKHAFLEAHPLLDAGSLVRMDPGVGGLLLI